MLNLPARQLERDEDVKRKAGRKTSRYKEEKSGSEDNRTEANKQNFGLHTELLGDHSEREPPDPIPNSEVKPLSADDSVAVCHVKVGNCQAPNPKAQVHPWAFFSP